MFVNPASDDPMWYKGRVARAKPALRKTPLQARSRERVERLLDAAEHEFAELGYETATTEGIAARAGASIGSLYQFFPNKKALFEALAERHHAGVRQLFANLVMPSILEGSWAELVDKVIDVFWEFSFSAPAFRAIWVHGNLSQELLEAGEALNNELTTGVEAVFGHHAPHLAKKQRRLVATVVVELVSAMLFVAGRRGEPLASDLRDESKRVLRRYLEPYMTPPNGAKRRKDAGRRGRL